jgi:hypothetical protein
MGFYKNVSIGFMVLLVLLLAIMAYILHNGNKNQQFPATISSCPDFYSLNSDGKCVMESSVYSNTTDQCKVLNINGMSNQEKKVWSVDCGVAWDGITNNSSI